jgi:hypothetical protein
MTDQKPYYPVTVQEWLVIMLLYLIPIYGIIRYFMMAGDKNINPVVSNFARAMLIYTLVMACALGAWIMLITFVFAKF